RSSTDRTGKNAGDRDVAHGACRDRSGGTHIPGKRKGGDQTIGRADGAVDVTLEGQALDIAQTAVDDGASANAADNVDRPNAHATKHASRQVAINGGGDQV